MRILIADDEPVFLRLLAHFMTTCGLDPICASDGDAAWAVLSSNDPPPLAVLDWEMPGRSGIELVLALKGLDQPQSTYCIVLTAHTDPLDIASALEAGAHDYVRKPMHHQEMRSRITIWKRIVELEQRSAGRNGSPLDPPPAAHLAELTKWWVEAAPLFTTARTASVNELGLRFSDLLMRMTNERDAQVTSPGQHASA